MILLREMLEDKKVESKKVGPHEYLITYTSTDINDSDDTVDESEIDRSDKDRSMRVTGMEMLLSFDAFYTHHLLSQTLLRCIPEELIVFIFGKAMPELAPILNDFSERRHNHNDKKYVGISDKTTKINIIFSLEYKFESGKGYTNVLTLVTIMPKNNFIFFKNTEVIKIESGFGDKRRIDLILEAARIAEIVYRRHDLSNDEKHKLERILLYKLKSDFDSGIAPKKRIKNKFKTVS